MKQQSSRAWALLAAKRAVLEERFEEKDVGLAEWQDKFEDSVADLCLSTQERAGEEMRSEEVYEAMRRCLSLREIFVVTGVSGRGLTLKAAAAQLGLSRERVRQIKHKALDKLRRALEGKPVHHGWQASWEAGLKAIALDRLRACDKN